MTIFHQIRDGHFSQTGEAKPLNELTTPDVCLITSVPYCPEREARKFEKTPIDKMLCMNVIDPTPSEKTVTVKDGYLIPRMEEFFDSLSGARIFSTLNSSSGYLQIEMHDWDKEKTTFKSPLALYRFLVMLFGLSSASSTFHQALDIILSPVK